MRGRLGRDGSPSQGNLQVCSGYHFANFIATFVSYHLNLRLSVQIAGFYREIAESIGPEACSLNHVYYAAERQVNASGMPTPNSTDAPYHLIC